jgi:hypothetical protein
MRLIQQIRLSSLVGALVEVVLVTPLFLASHSGIAEMVPLPRWVEVLNDLHWPGLLLIKRLYQTQWMAHFAARFPHSIWVLHLEAWLVILLQTTTFAIVAFVVFYTYGLYKARQE